jgi:phosphocarrier protein
MLETALVIKNVTGLHARPAALFVQKAASFKSKVKIIANNKTVDAKSILGVLGLGLTQGTQITVVADGEDEEACIKELQKLVENNFGEG